MTIKTNKEMGMGMFSEFLGLSSVGGNYIRKFCKEFLKVKAVKKNSAALLLLHILHNSTT